MSEPAAKSGAHAAAEAWDRKELQVVESYWEVGYADAGLAALGILEFSVIVPSDRNVISEEVVVECPSLRIAVHIVNLHNDRLMKNAAKKAIEQAYSKTASGQLRSASGDCLREVRKAIRPWIMPMLDFLARLLPPYTKGKTDDQR